MLRNPKNLLIVYLKTRNPNIKVSLLLRVNKNRKLEVHSLLASGNHVKSHNRLWDITPILLKVASSKEVNLKIK